MTKWRWTDDAQGWVLILLAVGSGCFLIGLLIAWVL